MVVVRKRGRGAPLVSFDTTMRVAFRVVDGTAVVSLLGGAAGHETQCLMAELEPFVYDAIAASLPPDTRAAEIGSFKGGSACILAHCMKHRGKRLHLFAHDLFEPFRVGDETVDVHAEFDASIAAWDVGDSVTKVVGDSKATHAVHADESLDYVFIDGDHSYEGAKADILNFIPKLKASGWLVVQDCVREVEQALQDAVPPGFHGALFKPPFGHYVVVCHRDEDALQALGARLVTTFERVMNSGDKSLPFQPAAPTPPASSLP